MKLPCFQSTDFLCYGPVEKYWCHKQNRNILKNTIVGKSTPFLVQRKSYAIFLYGPKLTSHFATDEIVIFKAHCFECQRCKSGYTFFFCKNFFLAETIACLLFFVFPLSPFHFSSTPSPSGA